MIGGGAGGEGGGLSATGGSPGSDSIFDSGNYIAKGADHAKGGYGSIAGENGLVVNGGNGAGAQFFAVGTAFASAGGSGGVSVFGGGGTSNIHAPNNIFEPAMNSGAGGAGGAYPTSPSCPLCCTGEGGGAGGYVEFSIMNPKPSYHYSVGQGGAGGSAGTCGTAGGRGADGIIIIEEYFS
jgi:hypothetical protein